MPSGAPVRRFETACDQGRWDEAETIARRELARDAETQAWAATALARCAQARGDRPATGLWLERAGRLSIRTPDFVDFLASMWLAAGDPARALAELDREPDQDPAARADGGTARVLAWLQTGRIAEAAALAEALLRRHPVPPGAPLGSLAETLARKLNRPGWLGCSGAGALCGTLSPSLDAASEVLLEGPEPRSWSAAQFRAAHGGADFILPVGRPGPWSVLADGRPLLGSGVSLSRPRIEGLAEIEARRLSGWASAGSSFAPPPILLTDEKGGRLELAPPTEPGGQGERRARFDIDLGESDLVPGRIAVTAGGVALAGSPIAWRREGEDEIHPVRAVPRRRQAAVTAADPAIDVVIPVYGDREVTLTCIRRVLATTRHDRTEIVVIDDATPDPALAAALDELAAARRITLLRNETNLGFPASANRGMSLHEERDVALLNSDASVSGSWLRRLRRAAYAAPDTGSVTALSNEASICSYGPDAPEEWPSLDRLARRVNGGVTVELPTAVGFCMYIRRDCLAETGPFSETLFGRGYGEENDFCLRARRLGWRHVAAADVLVGHVGGVSFGASRNLLQERNLKVLERLNPGYQKLVARFVAADPLAPARRRLDLGRWRVSDGRPAILLVTLGLEGGASRHVEERRRDLAAQGRRVLVLSPAANSRSRLSDPERPDLRDLLFDGSTEFEMLAALLAQVPVAALEIHHSLGHHPRILDLPARLGVPHEMVLHDYHWLCPQVTLIDKTGRYCGEPQPSLAHCEACRIELGSESSETITVEGLRRRSGRLLAAARRVVAPTRDVAARYKLYFPAVEPEVIPWDKVRPPLHPGALATRERVKICVIGAIGPHKGYEVLKACAEDAAKRNLALDFVVVGYSCDDAGLFATGRVHITGRYEESEAQALVRAQEADYAFIPSVCPETWCYALSLAWQAGLPAAAFDLGAQGERLRSGGGAVLPFAASPAAINDTLLALSASFMVEGKSNSAPPLATHKESTMSQITATPQEMVLTPGFYAITVVRGEAKSRAGHMALPAILISTPPGEARAEILSSHDGGWLTRQGDTVMLKVTGNIPVLLTSFKDAQAPGDTLDIQFSRVDGPAPGLAPAAQPAPAPLPPAVEILAHVQRLGDQRYASGSWAGTPGKGTAIEGFSISPLGGIGAGEIEYKGVTAHGWETPWTQAGQYCGTRQQALPLVGLAVRLTGQAAQHFNVHYEGSFINGGRGSRASNGAPCRSDVIGAPLEGILLTFSAKG